MRFMWVWRMRCFPSNRMTHPARISLCLAAISLAALAGCAKSSSDTPLIFDASSEVKFQNSLLRIEGKLMPEDKTVLSKAMGALEAYPLDGNCDGNNILTHTQKFGDPAYRQKIRLRRLHGLTAAQVIDQAQEKNCNGELAAHLEVDDTAEVTETRAPEQETFSAAHKTDLITLHADPYMLKDLTPRYASLNLNCMPTDGSVRWEGPISISVVDSVTPPATTGNGFVEVRKIDENVMGGHQGRFWQRGDVYFDEVQTDIPSIYKVVEKKVDNGYGGFELREERILVGPDRAYNDVLLPNLKSSKTMRLHYRNGTGPTFELGNIKDKIEKLEAQCVPEDSQE